jgi:hypothetical protein
MIITAKVIIIIIIIIIIMIMTSGAPLTARGDCLLPACRRLAGGRAALP